MRDFQKLPKLKKGDQVAVLSPSFAAPGRWPQVYELGLERIRDVFGLVPVEFPATRRVGASKEDRSRDLVSAFEDNEIRGIIASLGGDDQVTYVKNLPVEPFINNPKPFFGFSDNTHFENFLWLNGVPSFYGASLFTQFAMQGRMDDFTVEFLNHALFESGEYELRPSSTYNDIGLSWDEPETLGRERIYEENDGWSWSGQGKTEGTTWGGCLESVDEMLRHNIEIPTLKEFEDIVLFTETSEEIPTASYVARVYRALGERGVLERVRAVFVGRPKAWEFDKQNSKEEKENYRVEQRETTLKVIRTYNSSVPVIQNMDIGHTDPQIPLPNGSRVLIDSGKEKIIAGF